MKRYAKYLLRVAILFPFGALVVFLFGQDKTASEPALMYYSDYFSFIGEDDKGKVAFALDNNRGKDRARYQAEHFIVFHDEQQGWLYLKGDGSYLNTGHALHKIPDSPQFQFDGSPREGLRITSKPNDLSLTISAIQPALERSYKEGHFSLGSADAVLQWKNRTIPGKVIHEYLFIPDFNRLTRKYFNQWDHFNAIYVNIGKEGVLYFHTQRSGRYMNLTGKKIGFVELNGKTQKIDISDIKLTKIKQASLFYTWPLAWEGTIPIDDKRGKVILEVKRFNKISGWVTGGFAMAIVTGTLTIGDTQYPLYGFAELLI